jgi:hypothetical protein
MFRPLAGFKAQYHDLTMVVVSEFDEWRVVVHSPTVVLQGQRQFNVAKAKDHALTLAKSYLAEIRQEAGGDGQEPDWQPTGPQEWLVWKA